jgi:hypothetical protein
VQVKFGTIGRQLEAREAEHEKHLKNAKDGEKQLYEAMHLPKKEHPSALEHLK